MSDYKLCYIENNFAWFADCEPTEVCGDDWDDSPYEHNAGEPYDRDGYKLTEVAFATGCYVTPDDGYMNSPYSVEKINHKYVPWLAPRWCNDGAPPIYAGATIEEFTKAIVDSGGMVYMPVKTNAT